MKGMAIFPLPNKLHDDGWSIYIRAVACYEGRLASASIQVDRWMFEQHSDQVSLYAAHKLNSALEKLFQGETE